jgi:hypothetical protein
MLHFNDLRKPTAGAAVLNLLSRITALSSALDAIASRGPF